MAADETQPRPGDLDNNLLRKILLVLLAGGGGGGGGSGLTNTQLRASPVPVSSTVTNFPATQPVSGTVAVSNFPATQPVSGAVTVTGTVTPTPTVGALTDRSGTMTLGGTSQQLAAANATRKYFFFENVSAEDMWINFGSAAVANQPSIRVLHDGGSFTMEGSFVSNQTINVVSATTTSAFTAKEA